MYVEESTSKEDFIFKLTFTSLQEQRYASFQIFKIVFHSDYLI